MACLLHCAAGSVQSPQLGRSSCFVASLRGSDWVDPGSHVPGENSHRIFMLPLKLAMPDGVYIDADA